MKFSLSTVAAVASLLSTASAHGGVLWYEFAGQWVKGFTPYNSPSSQPATFQREWDSYDPLLDPTQTVMRCNANGAVSDLTYNVKAGTQFTAYWNTWPHSIGPVVVWMSNCNGNCTDYDGSGSWFKIDQKGLESGTLTTGTWGQGQLISQNSSWTSTIPASLPAGNYLLRHELLALHTANAPQWYPECAQITVTGGGSSTPGASYMAQIPGVYSMSDPNVNIDIYSNDNQGKTSYTIPGPPVFTG